MSQPGANHQSYDNRTNETHNRCDDVVRIIGLNKAFSAAKHHLTVFNDLNCSIEKRGFISIVGPSGCGKSTLLKLISGLELPDNGQILFEGNPIHGPRRGMIYVFQQYTKSILPWRTVVQNIGFGLLARNSISKLDARDRCREYIDLMGLKGYEDYYPYQLSGGMQQRVCIARALICEPEVLLMDEPFSAVDAMTRAILQELIMRIWHKLPITILFVTHDVDEAVFLSTRVLLMSRAGSGIAADIPINLSQPRDQIKTRADPLFNELRRRLFEDIFLQEKRSSLDQT